jgi:tetratricopeptide (TPR) repeat protein
VRSLALVTLLAFAPLARADEVRDAAGFTADDRERRAHEAYEQGRYIGARIELLAALKLEPRPKFLFALGQTAFNLARYAEAIEYWKRFLATNPSEQDAALAQQAIGHATEKLAQPPPARPDPEPVYVRRWDRTATALVVGGGAAVIAGVAGVAYAHSLGDDASGSERDYHDRVLWAHRFQATGFATAAAGVALIGGAIVRWRFHFERELEVGISATGVSIGGRL